MSAAVRRVLAAVASVVVLAGCAEPAAGPPRVAWGESECSRCRMIVSEARSAAVGRGPAGEEARFDDLGCLAAFAAGAERGGWSYWVHEADGEAWIPAPEAAFARLTDAITPMGTGLLAWATPARAQAASGAEPLDWNQLVRHHAGEPRAGGREGPAPRSTEEM